jgi:hypothetical protein
LRRFLEKSLIVDSLWIFSNAALKASSAAFNSVSFRWIAQISTKVNLQLDLKFLETSTEIPVNFEKPETSNHYHGRRPEAYKLLK